MKYDVALDLQGSDSLGDGGATVGREDADRIGRAARSSGATVLYQCRSRCRRRTSSSTHLTLASAVVGEELTYEAPLFPQDPATEAWADRFCASIGFAPLAIVNPGAGWGAKCWPAESYGEVAKALADRGMAVMVNYGPQEEALAEAVREASEEAARPVKCSVSQLDRAHPPRQPVCRRRHRAHAFGRGVGRCRLWRCSVRRVRNATARTPRDRWCCAAQRASITARTWTIPMLGCSRSLPDAVIAGGRFITEGAE